jgi:uncharacterized damage-inducible protein DinB
MQKKPRQGYGAAALKVQQIIGASAKGSKYHYNCSMPPPPEIQSLRKKLVEERSKLLAAVRTLSPEELLQSRDGAWSVKDILAHIANAEQVNLRFARQMLESDHPVQLTTFAHEYPDYSGPFELDRYNAYIRDKLQDRPLADVVRALETARADTLAWLDTLTLQDLERGGLHAAWGELTVQGILKILMLHDKMHTLEIAMRKQTRAQASSDEGQKERER